MTGRTQPGAFGAIIGAISSSLSLRVVALNLAVLVFVTATYAAYALRTSRAEWTGLLEQSALHMGEMIRAATHFGMLQNRKEDVHHTIRMLAQSPEVVGIRIYDKVGKIIFSADDSEIGHQVDMKAEACVICHEAGEPIHSLPSANRTRTFRRGDGGRVIGTITPIVNRSECANAACHAHPEAQTVLGVLDVQLSLAQSDLSLHRMQRGLFVATLVLALALAAASIVTIDRLDRVPVRHLITSTRRIAAGDLDSRVRMGQATELGDLAQAFNKMTDDLGRARRENEEWGATLEHKVVEKTEELRRAQRQLVQMEKMVSLGKLAATVAHELNNPLSGILTYARLVSRFLKGPEVLLARIPADRPLPPGIEPAVADRDELLRFLSVVEKESARCGDVVRNLLLFSRDSGARFAEASLGTIVDRAVMLVAHRLEMSGIAFEIARAEGDDTLCCDANQLQQALLALFFNAVEAMPKGGRLAVRCAAGADGVTVDVADTGHGIPASVIPSIFEPFFSTKQEVEGVGLGLAVVYGIVQRHGGTIDVTSEVGAGTTFHLTLPRRPAVRAPDASRVPTA